MCHLNALLALAVTPTAETLGHTRLSSMCSANHKETKPGTEFVGRYFIELRKTSRLGPLLLLSVANQGSLQINTLEADK